MRRREFITLLGGAAAAWPLTGRAQQTGKVWRVGLISGLMRPASLQSSSLGGFLQGMRELGYVEGTNFIIEWRFAEGKYERFPEFAAELMRLKVDIFLLAASAAIRPVQRAVTTIPIVMGYSTDPVGNAFVASLARPGGNTTGLASSSDDTAPKQLELLKVAVPNVSRLGVLLNPNSPNYPVLANAQAVAQKASLAVVPVHASSPQEIETAFSTFTREGTQAVLLVPDSVFNEQRRQIAELALAHRLPLMSANREYVEAGGLIGYGENIRDFLRRSATFVVKIFKGAKPADLPIEQPTKFELVINLKTAKTLGLTIPATLIALADEVRLRVANDRFGSRAAILKTRADRPVDFQYPTTCCAAVHRC
jgi:putative tryptophan/tyrosine transport system substrate-binding protein